MAAQSAGLYPAATVSPLTIATMRKRNIDMSGVWPKSIFEAPGGPFDMIVNMSGYPLPGEIEAPAIEWTVQDPISFGEPVYDEVANKIEGLVMGLILQFRAGSSSLNTTAKAATAESPKSDAAPFPMGPGGSRMYRRGRGQN